MSTHLGWRDGQSSVAVLGSRFKDVACLLLLVSFADHAGVVWGFQNQSSQKMQLLDLHTQRPGSSGLQQSYSKFNFSGCRLMAKREPQKVLDSASLRRKLAKA